PAAPRTGGATRAEAPARDRLFSLARRRDPSASQPFEYTPGMRAGPKPQPAAATLPPLKAKAPAKRVLEFFETHLRHVAGAKAGQPFRVAPWQRREIIEPLFGTIRKDELRQYRSTFVTMPRRNGKSMLASGVALYLLVGDNE